MVSRRARCATNRNILWWYAAITRIPNEGHIDGVEDRPHRRPDSCKRAQGPGDGTRIERNASSSSAVPAAKRQATGHSAPGEERRAKLVKAGVAVGIGSAAIVAALLYASNVKKKPKKAVPPTGTPNATD